MCSLNFGEDIPVEMATQSKQQSSQLFPQHPQFGPPSVVPVPFSVDLPTSTGNCSSDTGNCSMDVTEAKAELSSNSQDPLPSPACPFDEDRAEAIVGSDFMTMILAGVPLPVLGQRLVISLISGLRKSPEQRRNGARLQKYQLGFCDPSLGKANELLLGKSRNV